MFDALFEIVIYSRWQGLDFAFISLILHVK